MDQRAYREPAAGEGRPPWTRESSVGADYMEGGGGAVRDLDYLGKVSVDADIFLYQKIVRTCSE